MVGATIDYPGGDPRRELERVRRAVYSGVREGVYETALATEKRAKENIDKNGSVDRGLTRASIQTIVKEDKPGLVESVVSVGTFWGIWIEFGRRGTRGNPPGVSRLSATAAWPPPGAIEAWVKRKYRDFAPLGVTKSGKTRARTKSNAKRFDARVKALAFLIGRKIYRFGIKPRPFLLPAFYKEAPLLETRIKAAIARNLK